MHAQLTLVCQSFLLLGVSISFSFTTGVNPTLEDKQLQSATFDDLGYTICSHSVIPRWLSTSGYSAKISPHSNDGADPSLVRHPSLSKMK